jgi:hypothetical protein
LVSRAKHLRIAANLTVTGHHAGAAICPDLALVRDLANAKKQIDLKNGRQRDMKEVLANVYMSLRPVTAAAPLCLQSRLTAGRV